MNRSPSARLSNGAVLPMMGIGVDQVKDFEKGYEALLHAFSIGYRSVDTAYSYGNEEMVGRAVKDCGLPRSELFITTKLTQSDQGYDSALRAFEKSLNHLQLTYLDAYLIHWPGKYYFVDTWKALIRLYHEKCVRAIGVCNFNVHHLEALRRETGFLPAVEQIEWHPYFQQPEIASYCKEHDILLEGWSPLMCGGEVLSDPIVQKIAAATGKTAAQVVLRWHIQEGRRVFPKSVTPSRIRENFDIFDFELSDEQCVAIDALGEKNVRIGPDPEIFFLI